jgi:two-component system, chemotaxis family, protein-glutamate methylesterase/glutaminase
MSASEPPGGARAGEGAAVRVLIVDDSALVRELLTGILSSDPEIEVIGVAPDPLVARDKIKTLKPDVLTLDVEMPHMNGIEFLERIMRLRPMPVVMISTLTTDGADTTLRALELGAVDYVAKPTRRLSESIGGLSEEIRTKVKTAARARVRGGAASRHAAAPRPEAAPDSASPRFTHLDLIGIGASTGGVEAIGEVLAAMPKDAPGIVIVQHLPESFTGRFAARLDASLDLAVAEARDGAPVLPGTVHIGRGGKDFEVVLDPKGRPVCRLSAGAPGTLHIPSIDRLFTSLARFGNRSVGALLTGMGRDGAAGLKAMRDAGALTIAQDAATSVVYGMPRAAAEAGAALRQLPLQRIAQAMLEPLATTE